MEPVERARMIYAMLRRKERPRDWDRLDDRERRILIRRAARATLAYNAGEEGISRERVRQIEARALEKLASWQG